MTGSRKIFFPCYQLSRYSSTPKFGLMSNKYIIFVNTLTTSFLIGNTQFIVFLQSKHFFVWLRWLLQKNLTSFLWIWDSNLWPRIFKINIRFCFNTAGGLKQIRHLIVLQMKCGLEHGHCQQHLARSSIRLRIRLAIVDIHCYANRPVAAPRDLIIGVKLNLLIITQHWVGRQWTCNWCWRKINQFGGQWPKSLANLFSRPLPSHRGLFLSRS